jgi:hypothetical protein
VEAHFSPARLRLAALLFIVAWFLFAELRRWIPIWLPFLTLAALELHFLVAAVRERGAPPAPRGRAPLEGDVDELGGEEWREPVLVEVDGQQVWLPTTDEEEDEDGSGERTPGPAPAPRRPRDLRPRIVGVALLAILVFVLVFVLPDRGWRGVDEADRAKTEARLSAEAGRIAGHTARIHCDAEREAVGIVQHADGIAEVGGTNAYLTPEICYRLYRLAFAGDEGPFSQTARAIAVLAHEAWHLRGEADEGITNCYAFQSGVELGRRLGLSESTAARMMRQQLAENANLARSAPDYLVPGECRDGGRLDLDPGSGRFP